MVLMSNSLLVTSCRDVLVRELSSVWSMFNSSRVAVVGCKGVGCMGCIFIKFGYIMWLDRGIFKKVRFLV